MRVGLALGLAMTASGCSAFDAREVKDCEAFLLRKLKAPSTYHRVEIHSVRITRAKADYQSVDIAYDAENAYGAPIRDTQICVYPIRSGKPFLDGYIDHDAVLGDALNGSGIFAPGARLETYDESAEKILNSVD